MSAVKLLIFSLLFGLFLPMAYAKDEYNADIRFLHVQKGQTLHNIVTYHHEQVDGRGYPEGLRGEDIPLEARIIAVADVFDALTSDRPYKCAWSNHEALSFLDRYAGSKFDADCVWALKENIKLIEDIQSKFLDSAIPAFREGYTEDL